MSGRDFAYEGVSILEFEDGRITRFQAYFDRGTLGAHRAEPVEEEEPASSSAV